MKLDQNLTPDAAGSRLRPASRSRDTVPTASSDNSATDRRGAGAAAEAFLCALLGDGAVPASVVRAAAGAQGIAWVTVRRAADRLRVVHEHVGARGSPQHWTWRMSILGDLNPKDKYIHSLRFRYLELRGSAAWLRGLMGIGARAANFIRRAI